MAGNCQHAFTFEAQSGLTLGQNLPLGCFCTTVRSLTVTQMIEQVLHLHPTLTLRQLVGDTQLWRP
jgi:hypothetical protein